MIRVLLVDDQLLFRSMLEEMLCKDTEIEVVASAASGQEALELCKIHAPDVVLLDIRMPGMTGLETLQAIRQALPATRVAMLTTFEDGDSIRAASKLSADGYLVKDITPGALIAAVKCIYQDLVPLHRAAYATIVAAGQEPLHPMERRLEVGDMVFDAVDVAIMRHISEGKSNKIIAQALNYSEGTIKNRVSKLLNITGLAARNELALFAIKNQIV